MQRILFLVLVSALFIACSDDSGPSGSISGDSNGDGNSSSSYNGNNNTEIGSYLKLPSNANAAEIDDRYDRWMNKYYRTYEEDVASGEIDDYNKKEDAVGSARIIWTAPERTVSEGIGYGMLLVALKGGDWDRFDKLWAYSKAYRIPETNLMYWSIRSFRYTTPSGGSASDADIDILAALIIAYRKTGNQAYLDDAIAIGKSIYELELSSDKLLLPAMNTGDPMGAGGVINISYMSFAAMKLLSIYDKGQGRDWNAVLERNIAYTQQVQNAGTGLWPDWSDPAGNPLDVKTVVPSYGDCSTRNMNEGSPTLSCLIYDKESVRTPWRLAWYYHWFGDSRAKEMLDKAHRYVSGKAENDPYGIKNGYGYSDERFLTAGAGITMWTSLCATGLASAEFADWNYACNGRFLGHNIMPSGNNYYNESLYMLYFMLFNRGFEL